MMSLLHREERGGCCKKESNHFVNLRGLTTSRNTAVDETLFPCGSLRVKECRGGEKPGVALITAASYKANLWRHFVGLLYINSSIIILNNPQQGGDGGCMWQLELYLSRWMGDVLNHGAETQECFWMFCQPCINVKNVAKSKRGLTLINYVSLTYAILEYSTGIEM